MRSWLAAVVSVVGVWISGTNPWLWIHGIFAFIGINLRNLYRWRHSAFRLAKERQLAGQKTASATG